jgi:hypothetical protein
MNEFVVDETTNLAVDGEIYNLEVRFQEMLVLSLTKG